MRQTKSTFTLKLIPAVLAAFPLIASAAGLGRLTILSNLGQPLRAEVELNATKDELAGMTARVATPDAFRQAGIDYASVLAGVKLTVDKSGAKPVLRLSSDRPVSEPFLDVLLEVNWSAGRLVREYTFLLDPPDRPVAAPVAPVPLPQSAAKPAAPAPTPTPEMPAPAPSAHAAATAPAAPAAPETYKVKSGDTLSKIASQYRPEGVSLEQALVALFRSNPSAFDGSNMNRLRAGKILSLPDATAASGVSSTEAHKIVVAQTSDFNAYRRKLAAVAETAPARTEAPKQEAVGKIEPKVQETAPAPAKGEDQLKVSKTAGDKSAAGRIAALEENVVAKEKALQDANSRLAELERNVKELQQLLELKNQNLAELQKQAQAPKAAPAPVQPAPAVVTPAPAPKPTAEEVKPPVEAKAPAVPDLAANAEKESPPAPAATPEKPAEAKPEEAAKAPEAPVAPPKPSAPPPPVVEEPGFLDGLMANPALLGGAGALVLLLGWLAYRRSKGGASPEIASSTPSTTAGVAAPVVSTSMFGQAGGQSVDTSASSLQTDFSQSSLSAIDADEGVDPVAEADVYMAYGRDAQAEEILLEALKAEPSRYAIHLKLLEIYSQRNSVKQFEGIASELYAQTGGVGADWEKAAAMGRKVDPANPLYGGEASADSGDDVTERVDLAAATPEPAPPVAAAEPEPVFEAPEIQEPVAETPAAHDVSSDVGLDFDLEQTAPVAIPVAEEAVTALEPEPVDMVPEPAFESAPVSEPEPAPEPEPVIEEATASALDFDLGGDDGAGMEVTEIGVDTGSSNTKTVVLERNALERAEAEIQATQVMTEPPAGLDFDLGDDGHMTTTATDVAVVDLEKTDIGNLVDFNFEMSDAEPKASEPVIDLSDINLDLPDIDTPPQQAQAPVDTNASGASLEATTINEAMHAGEPQEERQPTPVAAYDMMATEATSPFAFRPGEDVPVDEAVAQEVETKLELARAYEEMGDKEGARELLQEVLKEGALEQQNRARELLARLS